MNVEEHGSLTVVTQLRSGGASGSLDHISPVEQMEAIDAVMRFYFGVERWLVTRNRLQPGQNLSVGTCSPDGCQV